MTTTASAPLSSRAAPGCEKWLTPSRFAIALAVLVMVDHADVVFGLRTFFFRDFGSFGYPLAHYHRESFWRGELPLWNPLSNCGLPFLAQWNTLTLYPLSLIYLLLPLSWALGLFCLFHQWLAGMGMFYLARRWTGDPVGASVAGVAYAFGGLTLNALAWPGSIAALAWLPWIILGCDRAWQKGGRSLLFAALAGAMQMLCGSPEISLLTWLCVGGLWLMQPFFGQAGAGHGWLRHIGRLAAVIALVAALSAAQLLPFLEMLGLSQRDTGYGGEQWAMPGWGLANFLVPLFYAFPWAHGVWFQYDQYWVSSYYCGAVLLLLAGLVLVKARSRRGLCLWVLAALALVAAMGSEGHLLPWIRKLVPQLGFMRYPVKYVILTCALLPLLGAMAIAQIRQRAVRSNILLLTGAAGLLAMAGLVWVAWSYPKYTDPQYNQFSATVTNAIVRALFLVLTVGALAGVNCETWPARLRCGFALAVPLLVWGDLVTHVPRQNPTVARWVYEPLDESVEQPRARAGVSRAMPSFVAEQKLHDAVLQAEEECLRKRLGLHADANLLDAIPRVGGVWPLELRATAVVESYARGTTSTGFLDFLGVAYVSSPVDEVKWQSRPSVLPLITGGQTPVFMEEAGVLQHLNSPRFDPRTTVFLPGDSRSLIRAATNSYVKIEPSHFSAQEIRFAAVATNAAVVCIAQAWHPAWQAYVNGQPVPLWKANVAFQALEIAAGMSEITLRYEDRRFRMGAVISLIALVGIAALLWKSRRTVAVA